VHVSTIIVSYNTFELTVTAIESAIDASPEIQREIIVVDNNSPDNSAARLKEYFFGHEGTPVTIIALAENAGFSGANNVGAKEASGEVLFFLNPDAIVHSGAISELHSFLIRHPEVGALGPYVLNPDGSDQDSVGSFVSLRSLLRFCIPTSAMFQKGFAKKTVLPAATSKVDFVKGCAIAMRREVYDQIGGWDESYFLYAEERELCFATRQRGYQNYFLRSASIVHIGGASTNRENYADQQVIQQRSSLQFMKRHHGRAMVNFNRALGILGFGLRASIFPVLKLLTGQSHYDMRGKAAQQLLRWYVWDYSPSRAKIAA